MAKLYNKKTRAQFDLKVVYTAQCTGHNEPTLHSELL